MSDPVVDAVHGGLGHRLRHQLPLLGWLVLVWNLLWGTWSWANLLSGIAVALVVTAVLPLPPVDGGARIRPGPLVVYLGWFAGDLVRSAALVAWQTVRPRGIDRSAIIEVQVRADSDMLITVLAQSLSLVPGSMVIDLDRERRTLALHVLHVESSADLERQRRSVLREEERIVRAFGSAEDVAAFERSLASTAAAAPRSGERPR